MVTGRCSASFAASYGRLFNVPAATRSTLAATTCSTTSLRLGLSPSDKPTACTRFCGNCCFGVRTSYARVLISASGHMLATDIVIGVATFALVAGYAALSWLRRGRDPRYLDDASILLPAPPPGMTAATATIVLGEDSRAAFMAALLDLASRDEIAFVAEGRQGGVDEVGIAIHGGEST